VTVNYMSERVPIDQISATIMKDVDILDRIRNESKDMEVESNGNAVQQYVMFHAGREIRADWPGSTHNLIAVCCGRPPLNELGRLPVEARGWVSSSLSCSKVSVRSKPSRLNMIPKVARMVSHAL
jgi:hypothetical protein